MRILKRWIRNLGWLFNHPPIGTTQLKESDNKTCDYCGAGMGNLTWYTDADFTICQHCKKAAFDKLLVRKDGK